MTLNKLILRQNLRFCLELEQLAKYLGSGIFGRVLTRDNLERVYKYINQDYASQRARPNQQPRNSVSRLQSIFYGSGQKLRFAAASVYEES